jgi:hypothetical protein
MTDWERVRKLEKLERDLVFWQELLKRRQLDTSCPDSLMLITACEGGIARAVAKMMEIRSGQN